MDKSQFRLLVVLVVVSGFVGGALVSCLRPGQAPLAQAETNRKVVTAQEFRLVDDQGRTRATLMLTASHAGIASQMGLSQPCLMLRDADERVRVRLDINAVGSPQLTLYPEKGGQAKMRLSVEGKGESGYSMLELKGSTGTVRLVAHPTHGPSVLVRALHPSSGAAGIDFWQGQPRLKLMDKDYRGLVHLSLSPQGTPHLAWREYVSTLDPDSTGTLAALDMFPDGNPHLGLVDDSGQTVWSAP